MVTQGIVGDAVGCVGAASGDEPLVGALLRSEVGVPVKSCEGDQAPQSVVHTCTIYFNTMREVRRKVI